MRPTRRQMLWLAPTGMLAVGLGTAAWVGTRKRPISLIGGQFVLEDGDGRRFTERELRGKWSLVYFGYTHCPDACPTALQDMANAVDLLGSKRTEVEIVFITVDPARDTPAIVKEYVGNFEAPIIALSGTEQQVAQAARAYRVYYAKHPTKDGYEMDHSSIIYLMDRRGDFVTNFSHQTPPEKIAATLREIV